MKLADVSIERPVFATMMILTLIVLGLFSFVKLNIDQFPDVDFPYVTVTSVLPGAGPEQIETDVTKKIEDAVNTIGGIDHITSISQEGVSIVIIQFKLEVEGKQAAQDVREKIAAHPRRSSDGSPGPCYTTNRSCEPAYLHTHRVRGRAPKRKSRLTQKM